MDGSNGLTLKGYPSPLAPLPGRERGTYWPRWWLLIPIVLLLVQISTVPYLDADCVSYLSIAQSLAEHGSLLRLGEPHLLYGVGYPLVLGRALKLQLDPFLTASLLNAVLGLIYLLGVWRWCRQVAPNHAVWVSCLAVGNATVLYLFRRPLSEPLFMVLLIWSSIFFNQVVWQLPTRIDWRLLLAASLLLCMLVATRHVGVFLCAGLVTWLCCLAWRGSIRWKQAVVVACLPGIAAGVTALALIYHDQQTKVHAPRESNWDMLLRKTDFSADHKEETLPAYLLEGLRIRVYEIGRLMIPGMFGCYAKTGEWLNVNTFIYVLLAALCFFGWWRLARWHGDSLIMMFPWYFALYVYWPSDQGGRFLAPMLPVLFLSLWKGLVLVPQLRHRWMLKALIVSHAVVALGLWIFGDLRNYHRYVSEGNEMTSLAHKLMEETGQIGVEDNASWPIMYMTHLLDRALIQYDPATPPKHLLWPVDRELPPGYVEASAGKSFRLARHETVMP